MTFKVGDKVKIKEESISEFKFNDWKKHGGEHGIITEFFGYPMGGFELAITWDDGRISYAKFSDIIRKKTTLKELVGD